jgi:ligand-binding sensor domain-containing protein
MAFAFALLAVLFPLSFPRPAQESKPAPVASETCCSPVQGDVVTDIGNSAMVVFQDKNNHYWFGSDGNGLFRYDGKTITQFTTKHGLSGNQIRTIKGDKAGNVFINTLGGISMYDGHRFSTLRPVESKDLDGGWRLNPDDVWLGFLPGQRGPFRWDGKTLYALQFPKHALEDEFNAESKSLPNRRHSPYEIYSIYQDSKGIIWLGTGNFGIYRFDGKSLGWMHEKHLSEIKGGGHWGIRSMIEDKDSAFWFSNTHYRFQVYPNGKAEQENGQIQYQRGKGIDPPIYFMSSIKDNQGDMWLAMYGGGVYCYDGKTMTHYPVKDGGKDVTLYSISKDNQGVLWLGSHAAGAFRFNGKGFERFRP